MTGLKLYKNGTLCGSILSKLVGCSFNVFLRQRLIWPDVPRQNT